MSPVVAPVWWQRGGEGDWRQTDVYCRPSWLNLVETEAESEHQAANLETLTRPSESIKPILRVLSLELRWVIPNLNLLLILKVLMFNYMLDCYICWIYGLVIEILWFGYELGIEWVELNQWVDWKVILEVTLGTVMWGGSSACEISLYSDCVHICLILTVVVGWDNVIRAWDWLR